MKKIAFLFVALGCFSCKTDSTTSIKNTNSGGALGTSYNLIYLSDTPLDFQPAIDSVFSAVNQSLSTYIADSDISKINGGDSTLVVDHMFREVFELSNEVFDNTNGYFDPTVGVLVNAWGFGPGKQIDMDSTKIDSLLHFVGFDKVRLTKGNTIRKLDSNIHFDFNAIAKGYAIDRLAVFFDQKGINDYLLEVGGELVAKGQNRIKEKSWVVGIEDPQQIEMRKAKVLIKLKDRAMASSGNYRKFRIDSITGMKYVHTIDPKTGFTKNSSILGATVLANTCGKADAYATAFMAMDLEDSKEILNNHKELDAYIVYLDNNGVSHEFVTKGFKSLIME